MLALKINDVKSFMNQLLIGGTFDSFPMTEASVTTYNTFSIDGWINRDFFDTDTQDILARNNIVYSSWKEIKPFCRSIIRGKLLPLHLKIIFQFMPEQVASVLHKEIYTEADASIRGFFLNIQYKNQTLLCTTGVSMQSFTMDKSQERLWDETVLDFFRQLNVGCEQL